MAAMRSRRPGSSRSVHTAELKAAPLRWVIATKKSGEGAGKVGIWLVGPGESRKRTNNFGYFRTINEARSMAKGIKGDVPIQLGTR